MNVIQSFDDYLEEKGVVPTETLTNARILQNEQFTSLPALLIRMGALSEEVVYQEMSRYSEMPLVSDDALHEAQAAFVTTITAWGLLAQWCQSQGIILWQLG